MRDVECIFPNADPNQPLVAPPARGGRAEVGQSAFSLNKLNEPSAFWDAFREALEALGVRAASSASAYDEAHALARSFLPAHERMARSAASRRLLGDAFVSGYTAVKALEYERYLHEISAWERRFLLPQG
ncbi:hypothetical protein [Rhodoferax sp.]|uniref:hypothetical protein n=1 Tax=Rhodoferax sp. TaxID=50421 RepID=UPI0027558DF9|nr:hypothetical protein [Rhodoferax sp.]